MTPEEMRALHPELFEIAEQIRARGGDVRIRCIRDEKGNVLAGKMPPEDPPHLVQITLKGTYNPAAPVVAPVVQQPKYKGKLK